MRGSGSEYERFAGYWAGGAGVGGFLYSVAFVLIARPALNLGQGLSWLLLMVGGLLATVVMVALYERLREVDRSLARGPAARHGRRTRVGHVRGLRDREYHHAPSATPPDLPSQIDPRGLVTFGFTGLGLPGFAGLMRRSPRFPPGLGTLGVVTGVVLIVVYLGRLIIFDATNPIVLLFAGAAGFILAPAWYFWLGTRLLNDTSRRA